MKLTLLFAFAMVVALACASPAKGTPKPKACVKTCDSDYKPICAGNGSDKPKSFGNICVMENHNCEHGANLKKQSDGECPGGGGVRLS